MTRFSISARCAAACVCVALFCAAGCRMSRGVEERLKTAQAEIAYHKAELSALRLEFEAARCQCSGQIEQRTLELPEDGNQWHTILILRAGWQNMPAERKAEAMFHSEPLLVSLKHQTHWHLITTDQPECQKFRSLVSATPCLIVERANGEVVYRESGPELGRRPHALTRAIRKEVERHCPDGKCLPLHPVPHEKEPIDEVPAVLREEEKPEAPKHRSTAPLLVVTVLAGAAGFAVKFRRAAAA